MLPNDKTTPIPGQVLDRMFQEKKKKSVQKFANLISDNLYMLNYHSANTHRQIRC